MLDKGLLKLLGSNIKYVYYTVACMIVGLLSNVAITACLCYAVKLTVDGADVSGYIIPAIAVLAAIAVRYVASRATGTLRDTIGRKAKKNLRERIYGKIIKLGSKSTNDIGMAGLTQISMEGVEQIDLYYSSYIPQFFYAMSAPVILFAITVFIDWKASLVLLACVPLIPAAIIAVSKYAKKIFAKYWGKYISMGGEFLDSVQGLKELKIFKADERQHKKINESAEEFRKVTMKVLTMQLASTTIMDLVAYGGAGAGIALSIAGIAWWGLSPINALFVALVAVDFFLPMRAFGSAFHVSMNGASAGKKITALLEAEEPEWGDKQIENKEIVLENVVFSYDGTRNVLKNVDMTFPEKGMTAIVGESGCGKSTIVGIVSGNNRPKEGSVKVGNTDMSELSRDDYYSHLSVVSYNTYIFNDSIRNNFYIAAKNASDELIWSSLEKVNLASFIRENGGLDKVINEDADNISGGQKQRLALAINLAADKDIYIFDEATSNIDVESEAIIMRNIKELSREKNVIVISHRLENVVSADKIYFLADGEVKECGTHDELLRAEGGYASLYNRQKQLENGYINEEVRA